ncbi:MAG TPA: hypothetical protein VH592_05085 [Gemmataceae bacterium]|jgi:hypothetical protein
MAALVDWSNSKLELGYVTIVQQSEQETTVTELQVTMFVDTCIFLHFKPFTQIKWRDEAKAERVTLAVFR